MAAAAAAAAAVLGFPVPPMVMATWFLLLDRGRLRRCQREASLPPTPTSPSAVPVLTQPGSLSEAGCL